jgi:hypothetical protein
MWYLHSYLDATLGPLLWHHPGSLLDLGGNYCLTRLGHLQQVSAELFLVHNLEHLLDYHIAELFLVHNLEHLLDYHIAELFLVHNLEPVPQHL